MNVSFILYTHTVIHIIHFMPITFSQFIHDTTTLIPNVCMLRCHLHMQNSWGTLTKWITIDVSIWSKRNNSHLHNQKHKKNETQPMNQAAEWDRKPEKKRETNEELMHSHQFFLYNASTIHMTEMGSRSILLGEQILTSKNEVRSPSPPSNGNGIRKKTPQRLDNPRHHNHSMVDLSFRGLQFLHIFHIVLCVDFYQPYTQPLIDSVHNHHSQYKAPVQLVTQFLQPVKRAQNHRQNSIFWRFFFLGLLFSKCELLFLIHSRLSTLSTSSAGQKCCTFQQKGEEQHYLLVQDFVVLEMGLWNYVKLKEGKQKEQHANGKIKRSCFL